MWVCHCPPEAVHGDDGDGDDSQQNVRVCRLTGAQVASDVVNIIPVDFCSR